MIRKFQDSPNVNWFAKNPKTVQNYLNVIKTFMGRDAIDILLYNIKPKYKKVLLPAYTCTEVTDQFHKHGFEIIYYDMHKFEIDLQDIEKLIKKEEIDIFYYMNYLESGNFILHKISENSLIQLLVEED